MTTTSEAALEYHRAGIQVLPLPIGSKAPAPGQSWKSYTQHPQTEAEVRELFREPRNVAWIAGGASRNLVVFDFDARGGYLRALANERFRRIVERTSVSRTGGDLPHVAIRTPVPCRTRKVADFSLDVRGEGAYTVEPYSLHKSGQLYIWPEGFRPPLELEDLSDFPFPWLSPYQAPPETPEDNIPPARLPGRSGVSADALWRS